MGTNNQNPTTTTSSDSDTMESTSGESSSAETPEVPEPQSEPQRETPEEREDSQPNAEAARYRRRLREAEAERDRLSTELTALRDTITRRAIDEALSAKIHDPRAREVLTERLTLADFRDDDGSINDEAVEEYTAQFKLQRSGWSIGSHGDREYSKQSTQGWAGLLTRTS